MFDVWAGLFFLEAIAFPFLTLTALFQVPDIVRSKTRRAGVKRASFALGSLAAGAILIALGYAAGYRFGAPVPA